ncbi:MAG: hypothetical protein KKA84_13925 [Bacteroidetes bacterium]|nr:hypothetical protein [Bacteroidota bacterium]
MERERHNINFKPETWKILDTLKRTQNKSISEIIDDSVKALLEKEGYGESYFRIMSSDFCDENENSELTGILDLLTADDLKVDETRTISL